MKNEELNRKMEFIVEQQAVFAVNMQKIEEAHAKAEGRISRLEAAFVTLYNTVSKTAESQQKTDQQIKELVESQKETQDRLNALIFIVERYLGGRNNGQS